MNHPTYNIALLNIFLKAIGEGFPEKVLCFDGNDTENRQLTANDFKQKVSKMRASNMAQARQVREVISTGLFRFVDGGGLDSTEKYCRKEGSDKYTKFFRGLWQSLDFRLENFFYEKDEAVLAYLITRWLVKSCGKEDGCTIEPTEMPGFQLLDSKEQQEYIEQVQQVFRSEYYSALWDVVENGEGNKTFYKWPIDELYKGSDKEKVNEIIKHVFGENFEDGSISTTFEKLKYEPGAKRWSSPDKLFQNELKDEKLKALLQDGNLLEKYQVFQSRMINAFVLENLRAILPDELGGKELAEKVFESLFRHVYGESIDLKSEFLVPDHDRKTKEYEDAVENLIHETNYEKLESQLENLDKDCPATPFFKNFVKIVNGNTHFYFGLSADDLEDLKNEARKNIWYLGSFSGYNFNQWRDLREEFF